MVPTAHAGRFGGTRKESYAHPREHGGPASRGFELHRPLDRKTRNIALPLHQEVIGRRSAVHPQAADRAPEVRLHRAEHVVHLQRDGLEGGPGKVWIASSRA